MAQCTRTLHFFIKKPLDFGVYVCEKNGIVIAQKCTIHSRLQRWILFVLENKHWKNEAEIIAGNLYSYYIIYVIFSVQFITKY